MGVQVVGDVLDVRVGVDSDGYRKDMCARKMELFVKTHAMRLCSSRATLGLSKTKVREKFTSAVLAR